MLAFIIPVMHPEKCQCYNKVTQLLDQTLKSICGQIGSTYRVIVVCNKKPNLHINNDKIEIIEVDFPLPPKPVNLSDRYSHVYRDKGSKVLVGLLNSIKYNPTHIMVTDADDYVSNRLSLLVRNNPTHNGWYFREGYIFSEKTKLLGRLEKFHSYCGTSHIIRKDLISCPNKELPLNPSFQFIQNNVDNYYVEKILGDHNDFLAYCRRQNAPLSPLEFVGAIWHADVGTNSSQVLFQQPMWGPIWGKDVSAEIASEFGVPLVKRTIKEKVMLSFYRVKNLIGEMTGLSTIKNKQL